MPRRPAEAPEQLAGLRRAWKRPCDRCAEYEATRFGRAQVATNDRGSRWIDVGLCERCAAVCAAPGYGTRSALGGSHTLHDK